MFFGRRVVALPSTFQCARSHPGRREEPWRSGAVESSSRRRASLPSLRPGNRKGAATPRLAGRNSEVALETADESDPSSNRRWRGHCSIAACIPIPQAAAIASRSDPHGRGDSIKRGTQHRHARPQVRRRGDRRAPREFRGSRALASCGAVGRPRRAPHVLVCSSSTRAARA